METIRDGKGRGFQAGVQQDGFLETRSIQIPQVHFHADIQANAFVTTFEHDIALSGQKEIIGVFDYTGENSVVVSAVGFNTASEGRTAFYIYTDSQVTSGGEAIGLNNTNASSRYNIDATVTHTDHGIYPIVYSDLGNKMWELYGGYQMMPYIHFQTQNSIIITPGTLFTIVAKSDFTGDRVGANILIFEEGTGY
jgi:hypothetical protein